MTQLPTEAQEALALMQWVNLNPTIRDHIIHIPNEGMRTVAFGRTLRRMGLKAGVSDYFLAIPISPYHGLWLELKRQARSITSDAQKEWIARMQKVGYAATIVYGWEEARDVIRRYLKGTFAYEYGSF